MLRGTYCQDPTGNYLGLLVEADSGTIRCVGHEVDEAEIQDWLETSATLQSLHPTLHALDMHDRAHQGVMQ